MTVREFVNEARVSLSDLYAEEEAKAVVNRLCEEVLGVKSYEWVIDPALAVPEALSGRLISALERLQTGEPLQYVLGYSDFCGFRFNVNPSVLIPRPETEELCNIIIEQLSEKYQNSVSARESQKSACVAFHPCVSDSNNNIGVAPYSGLRILDLCTGSGCIAWALALSLPGSEAVGVDISEAALETARTQPLAGEAARRGARIPSFIQYDILSGPDGFPEGDFDVIVSNPPYIRESEKVMMERNVLDFEPGLALFVPDEDPLLYFRAICSFSLKRLQSFGNGFLEINDALEGPVRAMLLSEGCQKVRAIRDFRTKIRFFSFEK